MKNILMILDNAFRPDLRVLKEIRTLNELNFKILLYCWDQDSDLPAEEKKDNFEIQRIKVKAPKQAGILKIKYLLKFYFNFLKSLNIDKKNIDYIYVHDFLMLPLGVFLKFKLTKKLIYDAHEIYHIMEWEKYPPLLGNLIFSLERILIKFTDAFILASEYRKNFYAKYLKKEINVIGNYYDDYDSEKKDLRKIFSLDSKQILFGYFGGINLSVRPIDKIIDLVQKVGNVHFFIGGLGVDSSQVEELIKSKKNVYFLGWLENVREYIDSLDYIIYIMNRKRKYSEYTAPNTIYLAISHNKPIITNVSGEPLELINKYNIGYYIEDLEKFKFEYLDLDRDRQQFIYNISKIKNKYLWSSSRQTYSRIFNNL